jgi:hypothetical protein
LIRACYQCVADSLFVGSEGASRFISPKVQKIFTLGGVDSGAVCVGRLTHEGDPQMTTTTTKVKLLTLTQRRFARGTEYLQGGLGGLSVIGFSTTVS